VVYKTKCKQTAMEAEKPETITLRLPRLYILVHNRNRVENAPYDSVIYFI